MGVTIRGTNNIPRLKRVLQKLGKKEIKVGIFGEDSYKYGDDADLMTIAYVQEYGATITPKKGKYLTIPAIPSAKNKRASDFKNLFFIPTDNGNGLLARNKGKDAFQVVFILVKSVTIPERSFIRSGFDANVNKIGDKIESMFKVVLNFDSDPDIFLRGIGMEFAGLIQKHMKSISSPPNAAITAEVKRSNNPLKDSGRLIGAIKYKIE